MGIEHVGADVLQENIRAEQLLATDHRASWPDSAAAADRAAPSVIVSDLCKAFSQGVCRKRRPVIQGLSFAVGRTECFGLLGKKDVPAIESQRSCLLSFSPPIIMFHTVMSNVQPCNSHAAVGPNGAGKTSTINVLTGFMDADCGAAIVAGHDTRSDMHSIYSAMGICPQVSPLTRPS